MGIYEYEYLYIYEWEKPYGHTKINKPASTKIFASINSSFAAY